MANTFIYKTPDTSPGFLLWQVSSLWQRRMNKALRPFNLTHTQFVILASIFWHNTQDIKANQIKLSQFSKIDPVVISNVLKTLDKKGFVSRLTATSLREKEVSLTPKGALCLKKAIKAVEDCDTNFFSACEDPNAAIQLLKTLSQ